MDFVLQVAVATKAGKKAVITLTGDKENMYRQLQDKLDVEDTTKSIAHIEVNPNSLLGKAIEDSYYYDEEDGLLDLNSIVERLNKFNDFEDIYDDLVDTYEIDPEFSNKTFFDFDDHGMDEIFSILRRDPMAFAKAITNSPHFYWTEPYLWYSETGYVGTSTESTDFDFSDKNLQKAVVDQWLDEA
jgi:hypothetical protein